MKANWSWHSLHWVAGAVCLLVLATVLTMELSLPSPAEQPQDRPAELTELEQMISSGKILEAKFALEGYLAEHPKIAEAHFLHGQTLIATGDYALAIDALQIANALQPGQERFYLPLVQIYVQLGWSDQAIVALTGLLNENVSSITGLLARAELYTRNQRPDLALNDVEFALSIEPDNSSAVYARAQLYRLGNQLEQAINDYQRVAAGDDKELAAGATLILKELQR